METQQCAVKWVGWSHTGLTVKSNLRAIVKFFYYSSGLNKRIVPFRVVSLPGCVHSGLCPFRVVSIPGYVPFRVVSLPGCVHSGLCPFRVVSIPGCVLPGCVLPGCVPSGLCPSGLCPSAIYLFMIGNSRPFTDIDKKNPQQRSLPAAACL